MNNKQQTTDNKTQRNTKQYKTNQNNAQQSKESKQAHRYTHQYQHTHPHNEVRHAQTDTHPHTNKQTHTYTILRSHDQFFRKNWDILAKSIVVLKSMIIRTSPTKLSLCSTCELSKLYACRSLQATIKYLIKENHCNSGRSPS